MSSKFNIEDEFLILLKEMHRNLLNRMRELSSESTVLRYDLVQFEYYRKELEKRLGKEKMQGIWSLKDKTDPYEELRDVTVNFKGKEIKLFSEVYLYETIGKEEARTVLALLNKVYVSSGKVGGF